MSDTPAAPVLPALRVGEWEFLPAIHELRRGDERRRLPRRLALILAELARTPGEPVRREDLVARCWRRRVIDDEVLSRSIGELRASLGDTARAPRYIETIPKVGYRLVAAVTGAGALPAVATDTTAGESPEAAAETAPAPLPRRRRRSSFAVAAAFALVALALAAALLLLHHPRLTAERWTAAILAAEHPYASSPGWEYAGRYSRDGRWIVFLRSDPPGTRPRIWVAERRGTAARPLTPEPGRYDVPVFGPNSDEVWYQQRDDAGCSIRRQPLFAAAAETVTACAAQVDGGLDFAPDGRTLAYIAPSADGRGGVLSLWDLAAHRSRALTPPAPDDGPDSDPRFRRDGRISFVRGPDTERRLLWIDPRRGGEPQPLIDDRNSIEGHAWTPDGSRVLVATDRHDYRALIALDPRNGAVTRLGGRGAGSVDVAPDGSVLYAQAVYNANLWISPLPSAKDSAKLFVATTRYASQPTLAPDDAHLAYIANAAGREAIWLRSVDGTDERRLPLDPQLRWVRPSFTPDGNALLLTAYDDHGPQVWRHDLKSGRSARLPVDAAIGRWNDSGTTLVLARRDGDDFALYTATDETGANLTPLPDARGVGEFHVAKRYVAWAGRSGSGVALYDLQTQTLRRVAPRIGTHNRYDWLLRDDVLYYCDYAADKTPTLYRLDPADGSETALGPVQPDTVGTSIAVAHDAKFVVYGHVDRLDIDLMMAEAP